MTNCEMRKNRSIPLTPALSHPGEGAVRRWNVSLGRSQAVALALLFIAALPQHTTAAGFVGDGRCGNPTCHGAALPSSTDAKTDWRPWKSARTQWLNRNIDRHSRAYATLGNTDSKRIAGTMGISATESEKCLVCHAPPAQAAPDTRYKKSDGVTCEHCHGPAQAWIKEHVERDWPSKRAQFVAQGFYDNNNFRLRAEKCGSCHVKIDHEIVAGGHPPLQFEMVAYAQIMKHWDDQDEQPDGAFSVDPTLWSVGQVVGLGEAAQMIAERAGDSNYQSLGQFAHFKDQNCYQCHHKLVEDGLRQARGHYEMVEIVLAALFPGEQGKLAGQWSGLSGAVSSSAGAARDRANALVAFLEPYESRVAGRKVTADETRKMLRQITTSGDRLQAMPRFGFSRPERSNVLQISNIEIPWWYTTGPVEQTVLAIQALCDPAFGKKCASIDGDLRTMVRAADRFNYQPGTFVGALGAIQRKLF